MNQTGAIGFAWDYTFFSDKRHSIYSQWKGWQRVTNTLRRLHPDMVCDNRQNAHMCKIVILSRFACCPSR